MIWQMLKTDQSWRGHLPMPRAGHVQVTVLNGSRGTGLAAQTAAGLRRLGFDVVSVANASTATATTTVSYPGAAAAGAYVLAHALTKNPAAQNTGGSGPLTLTIGADFAGVQAPAAKSGGVPASAGPASVQTRNAAASICSGVPDANPSP